MLHERAAQAAEGPPGASASPSAGRLKQSVCRWCFGAMPLDDLCREAAAMGLASVELLGPEEWEAPKRHGLVCALATNVKSNPIGSGFNRTPNHDAIVRELEERLPLVAAAGVPQQIVFSGNRGGVSDAEGLKACAAGLKRITPLAERLGVTLVMELLNSKVDHRDYQCDRTAWGVALVEEVGSPRFKLLYDIYHMQIMEGDVIRTITDHIKHIGHFHTAGVPGRHELDGKQELHYPAICRAIADTGFAGFLAQEFIPSRTPMVSLREAVEVCRV
ncbi:MAG: hydroxypyruvate isomerase family protein [Phycisphaerales bacterium]